MIYLIGNKTMTQEEDNKELLRLCIIAVIIVISCITIEIIKLT